MCPFLSLKENVKRCSLYGKHSAHYANLMMFPLTWISTHTITGTWHLVGMLYLCHNPIYRENLYRTVNFTIRFCLSLHWFRRNPSGSTMALGSTQPWIEMNTRNISWSLQVVGKEGWPPFHFQVPIVWKSGCFNFQELSEPLQTFRRITIT
jgi:hypothetical protein